MKNKNKNKKNEIFFKFRYTFSYFIPDLLARLCSGNLFDLHSGSSCFESALMAEVFYGFLRC